MEKVQYIFKEIKDTEEEYCKDMKNLIELVFKPLVGMILIFTFCADYIFSISYFFMICYSIYIYAISISKYYI